MPHVILKLYPGRTEKHKMMLTEKLVEDIARIANCDEDTISVAIEEVKPEDWAAKVYRPDILENEHHLYKKPGYDPFEDESNASQD